MRRLCAALAAASMISACGTTKPLENVPLTWKPTSTAEFGAVNLSGIANTRIQFESFRDARQNPQLVAENREEAQPKPVTTRDDVGAFVSQHLREVFNQAGLLTVDQGGDVVLSGEVRQFFVEETSTYNGSVVLYLKLRNRSGKTLWEGTAAGSAKRFGRSYSLENYDEVFSDSVTNAATTLLQDGEFRHALAGST